MVYPSLANLGDYKVECHVTVARMPSWLYALQVVSMDLNNDEPQGLACELRSVKFDPLKRDDIGLCVHTAGQKSSISTTRLRVATPYLYVMGR